ncbi:MAG: hypothetical protein ACOVOQ_00600 [Flavobacterium sp.]
MKTIKLTTSKELVNEQETIFSTYHLLKMVINNPSEKGFDVDEMMQRLKIMSVLDQHKDLFKDLNENNLNVEAEVSFEDADYKKLQELYRQMKWAVISQTIVDLKKQLDEAK